MVKIQLTNAVVEDNGYGLRVNGRDLDDYISTALGTKIGTKYGYGATLPNFQSSCCDVTVIINPHPVTESIETDKECWSSFKEMEDSKREQYAEKISEAES